MLENFENSGDTIVSQKNKLHSSTEYRENGCLKTPRPSISLTDDHVIINLDGYETTVGDLKEHVIDSYMYRKHLKELMKRGESL